MRNIWITLPLLITFHLSSLCTLGLCKDLPNISTKEVQNGAIIALSLSKFQEGYNGDLAEEINVIPALSTVIIQATAIPISAKFIVFQVHSFVYNASLSYNDTLFVNNHVNGTNIGLVYDLKGRGPAQVYLKNLYLNTNITVLVAVKTYNTSDPVPGGCNMEFETEVAPYLEVRYTHSFVSMKSQLASPPAPLSCSSAELLEYEVYHIFLTERDFDEEAYFQGIRNMLTVERIRSNGRKVPIPVDLPNIQRVFSAYPGTGSVFGVIVNFNSLVSPSITSAAYVPSVTYACSPIYWADTCEVLTSAFSKLLCAVVFFLGIFICFAGHTFFKSEMFIFGFTSGGLIAYMLIAMPGNFELGAHLLIAVLMGVIFGGFWLFLWWFYAIPALSTVLVSLALGYLVAAIIFFAGAGDLQPFQSDLNYWSVYSCIILTVPLLMVMAAHRANILACSILGSYAVISPIDHYIGSNLKYIIINTIRRATNKDFRTAVIDPPFQVRDLSLVIVWLILAIMGTSTQFYLQRNKPPFPPPSFGVLQDRQDLLASERQPLLLGQPTNTYASMSGGQPTNTYASMYGEDDVFQPAPGPSRAQISTNQR